LNAAVVYYGSPPGNDAMEKIACPVLGLYGGKDNRITSTVEATTKAMAELKKSYMPHVFDGAGHGFLRQQSGQSGANQKAADEADAAEVKRCARGGVVVHAKSLPHADRAAIGTQSLREPRAGGENSLLEAVRDRPGENAAAELAAAEAQNGMSGGRRSGIEF